MRWGRLILSSYKNSCGHQRDAVEGERLSFWCESLVDSTERVLENRLDVGMAVDQQGRRERHYGEHKCQEQDGEGAVVVHGPHCRALSG